MQPVSVIVPARDEADRIASTVRAASGLPGVAEVIVVDDGSSDGTAERAQEAGGRVLRSPRSRGKGAALRRGVEAARHDLLLLLDGDLGESALAAAPLLREIAADRADLAIAVLPRRPHRGGIGATRRLAADGIARLTGRQMQEPLSGQRALRRSDLQRVGGVWEGWQAEVAMTVIYLRAGLRVVEVPCAISHRLTGRSPAAFLHRIRQYLAVRSALHRLQSP